MAGARSRQCDFILASGSYVEVPESLAAQYLCNGSITVDGSEQVTVGSNGIKGSANPGTQPGDYNGFAISMINSSNFTVQGNIVCNGLNAGIRYMQTFTNTLRNSILSNNSFFDVMAPTEYMPGGSSSDVSPIVSDTGTTVLTACPF